MDGLFQNSSSEHEREIEAWMHAIIADGGVDRFDDLHLNRIDANWKNRDLWFDAALQAYTLAIKIRDRNQFPFSVVLGFSLRSGEQRIGVNFRTREDLEAEFQRTPPSLYLLTPEQEPWVQNESAIAKCGTHDMLVERIDPVMFGNLPRTIGCFYLEFRNADTSEYSRSVLIAG